MEILVSVICNTYNQEAFIRDALDSFVMQKTTFPFEVLVHDDASTDSTPQIIREYAERYPDLIKPMFQTENQYSQKIPISKTFHFPRAKGKYFALCEGDDYWTDPLKLQKQVDAMEAHPEIDICAHQAKCVRNGKVVEVIPHRNQDTIFTMEEVILGGGGFVTTASLMMRKELFDRGYRFLQLISLDYIWQLSGTLRGGMLYLSDCMSVYRQFASGSWTTRMKHDVTGQINHINRVRGILQVMNEETGYRYAEALKIKNAMWDLTIMARTGAWRKMLSAEGRKQLRYFPIKRRITYVLKAVRRSVTNWLAKRK